MGYKYFAFAGTSSLFEEDERPATVDSTVLQQIISGSGSTADAVVTGVNTNYFARTKRMSTYAEKKYVRGLPTSNHDNITVSEASIRSAITRATGLDPGEFISNFVGPIDEVFLIKWWLKNNYLNDTYFNWTALGMPPADPVWDESRLTVEIPIIDTDTGLYYLAENDPDILRIPDTPSGWLHQLRFYYTDNLGAPKSWTTSNIDLSAYDVGNWIQVAYKSQPDDGQIYYYLYKVGSGDDLILENDIISSTNEGKYLPVAILMHDKTWFNDSEDTPLHKTTNKLLKYLAVRGDEVKEDYLEQQAEDEASGDDTRDGAEEWDFFIHFACSIHSKIRGSMDYIYNWLLELETLQTYTFDNYQAYLAGNPIDAAQPRNEIHITEGDVDGFNVDYAWSYVKSITYPGTFVDEDGDPLVTNRMHSALYERTTTNAAAYKVGIEEMHGVGTQFADNYDWDHTLFDPKPDQQYNPDYAIFTRQFNDEEGNPFYTRVIVMGISQQYKINTLNTDITGDTNYNFRYAVQYMFGDEENVSVDLRIPLKMDLLKLVPTMHREDCVTDSLVATVFLVKIVHVKWYQTGFWSWLIIIVAVILIVLSFYYGGTNELIKVIGSITGLTGFYLYTLYWVLSFAIGFIISLAGALIGGTLGRVFTIIAMVVSAGGNPFANIKTAWSGMLDDFGWGTANAFLASINPITDITMLLYTEYETNKSEREYSDWLKTAQERQDELDDAWAELGHPSWMDPMDIVRAQQTRYAEEPATYYERTLNPNPGLLGYALISDFTEIAITLPEDVEKSNVLEGMFMSFQTQRGAV